MTVYIAGGSNSLKRDGWTRTFRETHTADAVNLSIGATMSMMAAARLYLAPQVAAGDTVVWEYGINDLNHLARGFPLPVLLRHIEYLLNDCAARGAHVLPLYLRPLWVESPTVQPRYPSDNWRGYEGALYDLFGRYGVPILDFSRHYRETTGASRVPDRVYSNRNHIATRPDLMHMIASAVADRLPGHRPAARLGLYNASRTLRIETGFCTRTFTNAALSLPVTPGPAAFTAPPDGPARRVTGLLVLTHKKGGALRVSWPGGSRKVSVSNPEAGRFDRHTLKFISFEYLFGFAPELAPGETIAMDRHDAPGGVLARLQGFARPDRQAGAGRLALIAGIATETAH